LKYCEEHRIDAYIPSFGQYKPEWEGFIYRKETDQYECVKVRGDAAVLSYKGIKTDSKGYYKNNIEAQR
jgi:hypothetical protein